MEKYLIYEFRSQKAFLIFQLSRQVLDSLYLILEKKYFYSLSSGKQSSSTEICNCSRFLRLQC